jgi:hypothetical protein
LPAQRRLIEASDELLEPFRQLRREILDKLDETGPGGGGQEKKRRRAKGRRGRKRDPGKAERDDWIREQNERLNKRGDYLGPKELLGELRRKPTCRWKLTYDIVRNALRPHRGREGRSK